MVRKISIGNCAPSISKKIKNLEKIYLIRNCNLWGNSIRSLHKLSPVCYISNCVSVLCCHFYRSMFCHRHGTMLEPHSSFSVAVSSLFCWPFKCFIWDPLPIFLMLMIVPQENHLRLIYQKKNHLRLRDSFLMFSMILAFSLSLSLFYQPPYPRSLSFLWNGVSIQLFS